VRGTHRDLDLLYSVRVAKRWKIIGLITVAVVVLCVAGMAGRVLLLDDGPYLSAPDVCSAVTSPDAKALIGTAPSSKDPYAAPHSGDGCRWQRPSPSDWQLTADVDIYTATIWSGDAVDRAKHEFQKSREFIQKYDSWSTGGHTIETFPGVADEAYLVVSKRILGKFVQWRMLIQARKGNASLWVSLESEAYLPLQAESAKKPLLDDFLAKAPSVISDVTKALHQ
jgi:hypothetical protein